MEKSDNNSYDGDTYNSYRKRAVEKYEKLVEKALEKQISRIPADIHRSYLINASCSKLHDFHEMIHKIQDITNEPRLAKEFDWLCQGICLMEDILDMIEYYSRKRGD